MYDPPGPDSGAEWVEVHNEGAQSVDLSKWKLNDGSNHVLNAPPKNGGVGSLVLDPGSYAVLADNAANVESEYADLSAVIDTSMSLSNASGTVSLINELATAADTVAFSKDEGASGDGASLQKQPDGSWLAALPTPGASNSTEQYAATAAESTAPNAPTGTTRASSYVPPPQPLLYADAGEDRTVIVGADVEFDGRAYDRNQVELTDSNTRFAWNFGDGGTAEGASVLHHFDYPGAYAVVLSISSSRFAVMDQLTVTAEPAALSFAVGADGGATIGNRAGHDLDLSGWIVLENASPFGGRFILPQHSILLSRGAMPLGQRTLGFRATGETSLRYPSDALVVSAGATSTDVALPAPLAPAQAIAVPPGTFAEDASARVFDGVLPKVAPPSGSEDEGATSADAALATTASAQLASVGLFDGGWWWALAVVLAALAGASVFVARRLSSKEWGIIEEKGE